MSFLELAVYSGINMGLTIKYYRDSRNTEGYLSSYSLDNREAKRTADVSIEDRGLSGCQWQVFKSFNRFLHGESRNISHVMSK